MRDTTSIVNINSKFLSATKITFLWSLLTVLFFILYTFIIKFFIKYHVLKQPFHVYSAPFFYVLLLTQAIIILNVAKILGVLKTISVSRTDGKYASKYILKYGILGFIFGILEVSILFLLYVFIVLAYGASALGGHFLYGSSWIIILGLSISVVTFLLYFVAGIKEGIKYV